MPVFFWNASSVGWAWVLSSTSMYSGQFDQFTTFSVSERSFAAWSDGLMTVAVPLVPHEASAAATPKAPTELSSVRRLSMPRARAIAWGSGVFRGLIGGPSGWVAESVSQVPSANTVRCQGLRATPVWSVITCLMLVYSSRE